MQPSVDEYRKDKVNGRSQDIALERRQLTVLAQAVVAADHLTGVPMWDQYLSYVAGAMESCAAQIVALRDQIADPMVVDHSEVMRLKILLEGWLQRNNAFAAVLALPKDLLEMGERAQSLLDRMPEA